MKFSVSFAVSLAVSAAFLGSPVQAQVKKQTATPKVESAKNNKGQYLRTTDLPLVIERLEMRDIDPEQAKAPVIRGLEDDRMLARHVGALVSRDIGSSNKALGKLADRLRSQGIDLNAISDLMNLHGSGVFEIESVEFVPGWGGGSSSYNVPNFAAGAPGYSGGEFTPGLPSKSSLVGSYLYSVFRRDGNGGSSRSDYYSDGSELRVGSFEYADGGKAIYRQVMFGGETTAGQLVVVDPETGEASDPQDLATVNESSNPGEAYEAYQQQLVEDQKPAKERAVEAVDEPYPFGLSNPEEGAGKPGKGFDKYQPADGSEGVFCPMTIDYCRRQVERRVGLKQTVLTGMVFVNPGDPDDQPDAPRLRYDPDQLVVNPDPNAASGNAKFDSRRFRLVLPVWVNPPGPNE